MTGPAYGTPDGVGPDGEWTVDDQLRAQAVSNLRRRAAFRTHLVVFALVNLMLLVVWLIGAVESGIWFPWFVFPLLGWGIGLGTHGWTVHRGNELSEQRIRQEMSRLSGQQGQ